MAYNKEVEKNIEKALSKELDLGKKKMFGGICYLLNGNMCFGIYKDYLIVRIGDEEKVKDLLNYDTVKPFDITGRVMKNWVMVHIDIINSQDKISKWLKIGLDFAGTLPKK